ncbi:MAG: hypothetical protein KC656_36530 [Myxococcales bacterium]|nr:hypothetical protein [Myxococcales bacterium]
MRCDLASAHLELGNPGLARALLRGRSGPRARFTLGLVGLVHEGTTDLEALDAAAGELARDVRFGPLANGLSALVSHRAGGDSGPALARARAGAPRSAGPVHATLDVVEALCTGAEVRRMEPPFPEVVGRLLQR